MEAVIKRGRGRPKGSPNKKDVLVPPTADPTAILDAGEQAPVSMPKAPSVPRHRRGSGYVTGWKLLEETLDLLPKTIQERISTQNEIDLIVQRVQRLIDQVDHGESGENYKALKMQMVEMEKCRKSGNEEEFWEGWSSLVSIVAFGYSETQTWKEIYEVLEVLRRLKETELKRHAQEMTSMAREDVLAVMRDFQKMFQYAVVGEIQDTALQARVLRRYQEFVDKKFNVAGVLTSYQAPQEDVVEVEYTESEETHD